ncbi:hypothetical protein RhiirA1_397784 [Rhizophagus irregularis]|uniref:Uncharacterized protein n=1 Tax=Rhizophagus irregularis TaxID=588596 RepID=A0A2N0RG29_9GLOM|nr:hypothetical protein RhiirA1_397784 [Rhizophagus irregularis]
MPKHQNSFSSFGSFGNFGISDENDSDLVYYKICEYDLSGSYRKPYTYTRKGGNTSSIIAYLRDKHRITKDNFTNYLDEYREPKWDYIHQTQVTDYYSSSKPCPAKRQELLIFARSCKVVKTDQNRN